MNVSDAPYGAKEEARQEDVAASSVPESAAVDHPEDECVCGDERQAHYSGTGSSMFNIYHIWKGKPEDQCYRFQLYKRADPSSRLSGAPTTPPPNKG